MGKFEIQRSTRLPSAQPTGARAPMDVDTGAGDIGQAIVGLGSTIFTLDKKAKEARDKLEFSEMQRKDTEIRLNAEQQIKDLQDPEDAEAVSKIWNDAQAQRDAIQSKSSKVNQSFKIYRNGIDPSYADKFRNEVGKRQKASLKANLGVEVQSAMEQGNAEKVAFLYGTGLDGGMYDKKSYDRLIDNLQVDMTLVQADRSIDIGDTAGALTSLSQVDISKLDDERRETYKVAMKRATEINTTQRKQTTDSMIVAHAQGSLDLATLDSNAMNMDAEKYAKIRKSLIQDVPEVSNVDNLAAVHSAVTGLQNESLTKEQAQDIYLDNESGLSASDRSKWIGNIEEEYQAGIGKAKGVAKDWGKGLISKRFQEFDPFGINKFTTDDPEEQRRYDLEWKNKNQYDEAVDQWVREQGDKAFTSLDLKRAAIGIYDDYEKIKNLELDAMEKKIESRKPKTKREIPEATSLTERRKRKKPIEKMTEAEKRERFQELARKRAN